MTTYTITRALSRINALQDKCSLNFFTQHKKP